MVYNGTDIDENESYKEASMLARIIHVFI